MSKRLNKICSVVFAVVLLLALAPAAFALPAPSAEAPYELVLDSRYGSTVLPGISYDLYYVADRTNYSCFTLAAPFDTYPPISADLNDMTADDWNAFTTTMRGYAEAYDPPKTATAVSDSAGLCSFPGLDAGLYLVIGHSKEIDGYIYTPKAAVIAVPAADAETDSWVSPMTVQIKLSRVSGSTPDELLSRRVLKVWNDGDSADRPSSVTVHLLENGEIRDTVVLNSENDWRYSWEGLSAASEWALIEDAVEGYGVMISQEGITFRVENTLLPPTPPDEPGSDDPGDPSGDSDGGEDEDDEYSWLPQTGMLWWPVPVLVAAGALFLVIGMILNRKVTDEE